MKRKNFFYKNPLPTPVMFQLVLEYLSKIKCE